MKRILGLDLGTASVGWAVVNEAENSEEQSSITALGSRVVLLSADEKNNFLTGKSVSATATRTAKRGARRNLQRYKLRREWLKDALVSAGIINEDTCLNDSNSKELFATYISRAKAVTEQIALEDFAKVLFMINKKRGYKSNRKTDNTESEDGQIIDGLDLAKELKARNITPGQYLLELFKKNKKNKTVFYRSDLQEEVNRIWAFQSHFYPEILDNSLLSAITNKSKKAVIGLFKGIKNVEIANVKTKERTEKALTWRSEALHKQLEIGEVAYAIAEVMGAISQSSARLALLSDNSKLLEFEGLTIGQYLLKLLRNNPNSSLKNINFYRKDYEDEFNSIWNKQASFYPQLTESLRSTIFNSIFMQRNLKSCKALLANCELEFAEKKITLPDGSCQTRTIYSKVCPKSSPYFQEFQIWQSLSNIRIIDKENTHLTKGQELSYDQKVMLLPELMIHSELKANKIIEILFGKKSNYTINMPSIKGNRTNETVFNALLEIVELTGHSIDNIVKTDANQQIEAVKNIFESLGYKTNFITFDSTIEGKDGLNQPYYKLWHLLYSYCGDNSKTGNEALIRKIEELTGLEKEEAKVLANCTFENDYASLSTKAIRKLLPHLQSNLDYSEACEAAGYNHSKRSRTKEDIKNKVYKDKLDLLPRNSLRNPIVEKILNQMIHVINQTSEAYGKPDEIRIEMAREFKKNKIQRKKLDNQLKENTAKLEHIKDILRKDFKLSHISHNDILRYRLYEELSLNGYKTLYSNTYIDRQQILDPTVTIEHIVPKALAFDDSFSNKTLEIQSVNGEKSNQTAFDFISKKYGSEALEQYINRVNNLFENGKISKTKRDNLLRKQEDIPSDFLNRDLRNTEYIAKKALEILEDYVPRVTPTIGEITKTLREDWQLVNIMRELNWEKYNSLGLTSFYYDRNGTKIGLIHNWTKRNDHRHHAMDALTIAFTKPSIIQYLNNLKSQNDKGSSIYAIQAKETYIDETRKRLIKPPYDIKQFRNDAKQMLDNIFVSHKAKNKVVTPNTIVTKKKRKTGKETKAEEKRTFLTPRGPLSNETVYRKICNYETKEITINSKLTYEIALTIAKKKEREAVLERLVQHNNNPTKAFKNYNKNPIMLQTSVGEKPLMSVKIVNYKELFVKRSEINEKLDIKRVLDAKVRARLTDRLKEYNNDPKAAFANLEENPIWLNEEKGIALKHVTTIERVVGLPIRPKRNINGEIMKDEQGQPLKSHYVATGGNHHVAIYEDEEGKWHEKVVSFNEATSRAIQKLPIIDKDFNKELGWVFQFTMKQNEMFVFPDKESGFDPLAIDLKDSANKNLISKYLYRVQNLSSCYYIFRHHLETNVEASKELKEITWKSIRTTNNLRGIIKVRINHIGQIIDIGEY